MSTYPLNMTHPQGKKSEIREVAGQDANSGRKFTDTFGTPDRFPPIVVNNQDQEEEYRAKGYLASGESPIHVDGYHDFPKWLVHPEFVEEVPLVNALFDPEGRLVRAAIPGTPAKYPSLLVTDLAGQKTAFARGYIEQVAPDPRAMEALVASPYVPGRVTSEYPKMVDGVLVQDPAIDQSGFQEYPKWVGDNLVNSRAEELALNKGLEPIVDAPSAFTERANELKRQAMTWTPEMRAKAAATRKANAERKQSKIAAE